MNTMCFRRGGSSIRILNFYENMTRLINILLSLIIVYYCFYQGLSGAEIKFYELLIIIQIALQASQLAPQSTIQKQCIASWSGVIVDLE